MQADFTTRSMTADDYDAVVALWRGTEGVEVAEGDSRGEITAYLQRNAGLSRVAEANGRIVGAVLCGHDGRRGLLYHLAVASDRRGQGVGRRLVAEGLAGLRAARLPRAILLVAAGNSGGREFWLAQGFSEISGATAFGIDLG